MSGGGWESSNLPRGRLGVHELEQRMRPPFTTQSGILHAAEWQLRGANADTVQPDHAEV